MADDRLRRITFAGVIDLSSHRSSAFNPPKATPANLDAIPDTSSMVPRFRGFVA
jgi:hypothetical protein